MKVFIILILILISCTGKSKESTKEGEFELDFLFEKNGCKIYRFYDVGRYIYWSNCAGNMQYNFMQNQFSTEKMQSFTNN